MSLRFFEQHRATLEKAVEAIRRRDYWSAYPEAPSGKVYGESAKDDALKAFNARMNKPFELGQPGTKGMVGEEVSPYGPRLGVTYPRVDLDALLSAAQGGLAAWRDAGAEARVGVCLEILHRLNRRSFEIAQAVMHTTGQAFMMAFQAGGPHAQDRGLEAVAQAWEAMRQTPASATWTKQVGKEETVTLTKQYHLLPRGVGVVIGCSTFPTWNSYPGLFASLATGNAVVVKPHPQAVLPLAMTVETARQVLREAGQDVNLVTLAADTAAQPIAKELCIRPEVKIVDYTGSSEFGAWVERHATQAVVYSEKAGVNSAVIDSVADLRAASGNLGFSLCLYSGQMCTTPQNIFIPRSVTVNGEKKTFDDVAKAIVGAVDWLLSDGRRAAEILGAIATEATVRRIAQAAKDGGEVLRASAALKNETFPEARVHSPLILKAPAERRELYMREMFGPITYLIETESTEQAVKLAAECARTCGAITAAVYSTDEAVRVRAERALVESGAAVSSNLTGSIWVNQSAAFSDYHVSGANPSGNATLCDAGFVTGRFRVGQSRVKG